jgi:metal-sulfur cluster biosynthetic enzyme
MRDNVPCEFPAEYDGTAILDRLAQVLDPELDESILDLGFVRSLQLRSGHASVALRLPTSWCAVNFAYLMAEDIRRALLMVEGVRTRAVCHSVEPQGRCAEASYTIRECAKSNIQVRK